MKRSVSALCATAMMLAMAAPANAGVFRATSLPVGSDIVRVQGMDYSGGGYNPDDHRRYGDRVIRRGDYRYWRGYRGSRHHRPGYQRHGDWWFPAGAFIAGAIVGGAITRQPGVQYRLSSAHVRWCHSRYKSYREWDNTFQPYHGPRRACVSPY